MAAYPELQVKEGKDLLVLADEALIQAKKRGRNRSLLNLGRNRYKSPRGKILGDDEAAPEARSADALRLGRLELVAHSERRQDR